MKNSRALSQLIFICLIIGFTSQILTGADILLINGNLIDGTGADPVSGVSVLIRGEKILSVGKATSSESVEVIDLEGRWILPGLIDSHSHLSSADGAERALLSGVTTIRVLGTGYLQSLGLRELIRNGSLEGPELLVSGGIIRPILGIPFVQTFPQFGKYLNSPLKGEENVAEVVRTLLDKGVDVIKVGASGRAGLASTDPREPELSQSEIEAAVGEASKRNVFVAAHAHGKKGAAAAVRAGVRSIEHGTYLSDESLKEMKAKGIFLVPTLAVMSPRADPPGLSANAVAIKNRIWHMQTALHAVVRKAYSLGIPIAASTDGSYGVEDETATIRVAHDIEDLVSCGLTPLEAIESATKTGAILLGIEDRTGTVIEGKEADLIVVDRNPLEDIRALFEPIVIINNGKLVVNRIY
jgi:imidazolonepropionase-like amidohydrolase